MARGKGRRTPQGSRFDKYTESVTQYKRRQARDRIVGTAALVVFGALLLANLVMEFAPTLVLLPGGHSELYFMLSLLGLGGALWIRFDLGMNRGQRR